jgi:DNA processing protein
MTTTPVSERAARAALSTFRSPADVADQLEQTGPVGLWHRLTAAGNAGPIAHHNAEAHLAAGRLIARFVIPGDSEWPTALDSLGPDRPFGLWVRGTGDLSELSASAVALTGRRAASDEGCRAAGELARVLVARGRAIASPLSYGIDTAAQNAAQAAGAATLALLPCGLDRCHPHNQTELLRRAADGGVAVSAYPPGTPASSNTIHTTARLLAGLTRGIALVEPSSQVDTVPYEALRFARRARRRTVLLDSGAEDAAIVPHGRVAKLLRTLKVRRVATPAEAAAELIAG